MQTYIWWQNRDKKEVNGLPHHDMVPSNNPLWHGDYQAFKKEQEDVPSMQGKSAAAYVCERNLGRCMLKRHNLLAKFNAGESKQHVDVAVGELVALSANIEVCV